MNMHAKGVGADARAKKSNCDPSEDILVRLDSAGFVANASPNAARLGVDLATYLLKPHITDFASAEYRSSVSDYLESMIEGTASAEGIEFPVVTCQISEACEHSEGCTLVNQPHWYRLTLRRIDGDGEGPIGAVGTLQSVQQKYDVCDHEPVERVTDPITELADRRLICEAVADCAEDEDETSLALFAIDGMKAIFMQYGQNTADEIRWGFARFLEAVIEPQFTLAQIDEERFGVILPGTRPSEAREWASQTLQTFSALSAPSKGSKPQLSASAGIARAESSAEWTIRQGELGLVMARAAGGMQAAICRPHSTLSDGRSIEQAMGTVVDWTARRAAR